MTPLARIVLASASPRRLELLRSLGIEVIVAPAPFAEDDDADLAPIEMARRHARGKMAAVVRSFPDEVVVTADTVVDLDGRAFNKPRDATDAVRMLRALSGRTHRVHTAFVLAAEGRIVADDCETTAVRFHTLDDDEIAAYVATGEPMDKAGAYGIQGRGALLVDRIEGDFYTVMGFPLARFARALRHAGYTLPEARSGAA
jgi:septum formation protein